MKKNILFIIIFIVSSTSCWAIKLRPTSIVQDFISKVNVYASDDDPGVHEQLLNMCETGFRASDQLTRELYLRQENAVQSNSYGLAEYLLILQEVKGKLTISGDIKERNLNIPRTKNGIIAVEIKTKLTSISYAYSSLKKTTYHNLVYLNQNGKIVGIGDYDEDTRKPNNKLELQDFSFTLKDTAGVYSSKRVTKVNQWNISYLFCEVDVLSPEEKRVIFCSKIIKPDGTMDVCPGCTNLLKGYTFTSQEINIPASKYHYSIGYGSVNGSFWEPGTYRWEVWTKEGLLGYNTFEILPPLPPIEVSDVKFACTNQQGGPYGDKLFQEDAHYYYLYTKIRLKSPTTSDTSIKIAIYNPSGTLNTQKESTISSGFSEIEINCGYQYYTSGTYTYKILTGSADKVLFEGSFYLNQGAGIRTDYNQLTFKENSLLSKKIHISRPYDARKLSVDPPYKSKFTYRKTKNNIIIKPKWYVDTNISESWTLEDPSNGARKKITVEKKGSRYGTYGMFADYMDSHGLYRLEFGAPKMFAGPKIWGAELSVCDLRLKMAGLSLVNFGIKSSYDLSEYQVYYAPQISCLLPAGEGYYCGHAVYLSAGPTIEIYKSPESTFRPYWFTAEVGYRLSVFVSEYDFFVKYVDGLVFGFAARFGLPWKYL